jgi:hypothetical protein
MANAFSKEERVAFEDILEGFQDALVLSRNVSLYNTNSTEMERSNKALGLATLCVASGMAAATILERV